MSRSGTVPALVNRLLQDSGITRGTTTRSGWCLREGLIHIMEADNGSLMALVQRNGPPTIYSSLLSASKRCRHDESVPEVEATTTARMKEPSTAFESLCRIIVGQQLGGAAAQAAWSRLNQTCEDDVSPERVGGKAALGLQEHLQKPAGISLAKAKSLADLARRFQEETLSEEGLCAETSADDTIREQLLEVKGLGPWSCDMFLMFFLERPNVLPLGDLGVRKGLAKHFRLKGKGKSKSLCPKRDQEMMIQVAKPFDGFSSLLAYYMWKAADTPDFYQSNLSPSTCKQGESSDKDVVTQSLDEASRKRPQNIVSPEPRKKRSRRSRR